MYNLQRIRQAIIEAIPLTTANHGETPDRRHLYLPPAHIKALRLECNLVIGARGVGKSFWTAALGSREPRASLGTAIPELERADVRVGFGVTPNIEAFPDGASLSQLMESGSEPYDIWRTVVARWLTSVVGDDIPKSSWSDTVTWVRENPEPFAKLAQRANKHFSDENRLGLIVFDALDRTSSDWRTMDCIVRALLRVVLWLKSYPCLHAKVFLREDQSARTITDFADASNTTLLP